MIGRSWRWDFLCPWRKIGMLERGPRAGKGPGRAKNLDSQLGFWFLLTSSPQPRKAAESETTMSSHGTEPDNIVPFHQPKRSPGSGVPMKSELVERAAEIVPDGSAGEFLLTVLERSRTAP